VAEILERSRYRDEWKIIPYGEIRFMGDDLGSLLSLILPGSLLFGSFSKIISPGMRIGMDSGTGLEMMDKLITAKQASDLTL
jgi:2-aminoadipate transaminase